MSSISSSSGFSHFIDHYASYDSTNSQSSNRSTLSSTPPSSDVASTAISLPSTTGDSSLSPSLPSISLKTDGFSDSSIGSERSNFLTDFWETVDSSTDFSTDSFISFDDSSVLDNSGVLFPLSEPFLDNSSMAASSTPSSSKVASTTSSLPSITSDSPLSLSLPSISPRTYEFSDSSIGSERSHLTDFWETVASPTDSFSFISSDDRSVLDNSDVPSALSEPFLDNFISSHMPTLPSAPISAHSPPLLSSAVLSTPSSSPSTTSSDVSNPSLSSSSSSKLQLCASSKRGLPSEFLGVANFTSESIGIDTDRLRLVDIGSFKSYISKDGDRDFYLSDAPNGQSIVLFKTRSLAEKISKQRSDLHPYLSPFAPGIDPTKELFGYCRGCRKVQLVYRGFATKAKDGCCSWYKANKQANKNSKKKAILLAKLLSSTFPSAISHPASALLPTSMAASSTTTPSSSIISTSTTLSSTTSSSEESSTPAPSPSTSSDVSNPSLSSSSLSKLQLSTSSKRGLPSHFFGVVDFTSESIAVEMDRLRLIDPDSFKSYINKHGDRNFYLSDAPNGQSIVLFKTRSLAEKISKQRSDLHPYLSPFGPGIDPIKELFEYCKRCKKVQLVYRGFASKNKDGCCSWKIANKQADKEKQRIPIAKLLSSTSSSAISPPASALLSPSMVASSTTTPSSSIISTSTTLSSTASSSEESSTPAPSPSTTSSDVSNPSLSSSSSSKLQLSTSSERCPTSEFFGVVDFTSELIAVEMDRLRLIDDPSSFKSQSNKFGHKYFYISDAPNGRSIILFKTRSLAEEVSKQRSDLYPYLSPFGPVIDPTKELFKYCKSCRKVQLLYRGLDIKTNDGCCSWYKANNQAKKAAEKAFIQAQLLSSTSSSAIIPPASALLSPSMPASSMAAPSTPSFSIISPSITSSSTTSSSEASSTSSTLPPTTDVGNSAAGLSNASIFAAAYLAAFSCALESLQATTPTAIPNTPLPNINTDSTTSSSSSSSAVASVASSKKRGSSSGLPADKKARLNSGKTILKSHRPS